MIDSYPQEDRSVPRYAILADHPPEICPSSNSRSRGRAIQGLGQDLPRLSAEAGITFVIGLLHLDPGHRTLSVVDAPSIEAVIQLVHATGLSQWNTVEVCPVLPVADMLDNLDAFPIVFE
jgi:hypothetical protein